MRKPEAMEQQSSSRAGQARLRGESPTTAARLRRLLPYPYPLLPFNPANEQDPNDERGRVIYDSGVSLMETWRALERMTASLEPGFLLPLPTR
jgi:hypothetical protein